ncbi:hypothetical protein [Rhizobium sp. SGZ-381]|uniref:hypothetical protein n=1 Tax=Rhizobium sp. SGZ-381 TaxID=3342800 RepID=UPI00366DC1F5
MTKYALTRLDGRILDVGLTLAEAASALLTYDSAEFEVRSDDDGWMVIFTRAARSGGKKWTTTVFCAPTEEELFLKVVNAFDNATDALEAVDEDADSGWWKIAPAGGEAVYGYGSRAEADEYAELLDCGSEPTAVHHVSAVSWHDAHVKNLAEYGDLNLDDELRGRAA